MTKVKPKKYLGQHFLVDPVIATRIVDSLTRHNGYKILLEIGGGTGMLTDLLYHKEKIQTWVIDIDKESIDLLVGKHPEKKDHIIKGDFLKFDLNSFAAGQDFGIIGNLPYNISSQIFFKILDSRDRIAEVVCMVQKEVGKRIASPPGSKQYGKLSVLLQAFYEVEYLYTVKPGSFYPPPKVTSSVLRFKRLEKRELECDETMFFILVKQAFQNRRKTLRNALKGINLPLQFSGNELLQKRAEQLTVNDFIYLTRHVRGSNEV